LADISEKV